MLEIHLIIRAALAEALHSELVTRNVAVHAKVPRPPSVRTPEPQAWTAEQLRAFLREAAGHRLFPAFWLLAFTGMRRSELLGLRWTDIDLAAASVSINRGLVAVGYELHESRGKTANARRRIDLDPTTVSVLAAWRQWQHTERHVIGADHPDAVFTNADGEQVHPALHLTGLRAHRRPRRHPADPAARPAPYTRHPAHQGWRPRQGRQ